MLMTLCVLTWGLGTKEGEGGGGGAQVKPCIRPEEGSYFGLICPRFHDGLVESRNERILLARCYSVRFAKLARCNGNRSVITHKHK